MEEQMEYMQEALIEAKKAYKLRETPIGCVIVYQGKIIARAYNRRNTDKQTAAHAEMLAIKRASEVLEDWRLEGCTLYVTLEPCPMCAGAIFNARIKRLVYGASDSKAGACGSLFNIVQNKYLNHRAEVTAGVMEAECGQVLKEFLNGKR